MTARALDQEMLQFFEAELLNPGFPDPDAKTEFFVFTQASNTENRVAAFKLLQKHRPGVAKAILKEAAWMYWGELPEWVRQVS
ncbi:MAG: hypothetical protein A3B10_02305 [Candidatus Doudnabacteria bacterium RIFCSPLOWO2_01_FULL_44_21]|uniref:Uncharacterized protein n=1 Tax=Candidatus Doudnabacteria bacterium RIFCSPLOWO2_01_FULL_44_21 TaxID=1817841 RepID=A0A1F5PXX3_9BACT|nr:MAG: hypothetical protein A3B10_02305 [Candidatus Doudnabacteria bacterium RIFCSPLOWO2_01_FULL_44_21]OGH15163.1 MAG: hypothetical protein A2860_04850 [Candidatus Levybacteria bacterium RIFCSPHIGHO2_01_FULL_37_33]